MKHEWRKKEKEIYSPKSNPEFIDIPGFNFLTIAGEGNPNSSGFADCISALYSVSYAIKMTLKKSADIEDYIDYAVYPLEGVWDINEEAKKTFSGIIKKDDFVFNLMIRQPDFVDGSFVKQMIELTKVKKPHRLLDNLKFEEITDGDCVQMLHIGGYDREPESFARMEEFAKHNNLVRISKVHREIYLSDFRNVPEEKLKTVLRFKVESQ